MNNCDLITTTGIKIFYPKLYELIKPNGAVLSGIISPESHEGCKRDLQELAIKLDAVIKMHNDAGGNGAFIRGMLVLLFPRLNVVYNNMLQTEEHYQNCIEKKRICSAEHFELYFSIQYKTL